MAERLPSGTPPSSWLAMCLFAGAALFVLVAPALNLHPAWVVLGVLVATHAATSITLRNTNRKDHHHD